jgi:hypothetical protein
MSYSIKGGKLTREDKWKTGNAVFTSLGRDASGKWWWVEDKSPDGRPPGRIHNDELYGGPFDTKEEAEKDSQIQLLGSQCEVRHGGTYTDAMRQGDEWGQFLLGRIKPEGSA